MADREFADQLEEAARDELESALEASGLLFAAIGAARSGAATLRQRPAGPATGATLDELLVVGGEHAEAWRAVLAQIPVGSGHDGRLTVRALVGAGVHVGISADDDKGGLTVKAVLAAAGADPLRPVSRWEEACLADLRKWLMGAASAVLK